MCPRFSFVIALTEINKVHDFSSLLRRGVLRATVCCCAALSVKVAVGLGRGKKRQRAGNAGDREGNERREASAIFRAVGWSDLRFGDYG